MEFDKLEIGSSHRYADQHARERKMLLSQIDSELLKVLKETSAFLAGGALTSVFSDMPINDFDIYCETLDDMEQVRGFFSRVKAESVCSTDFAQTYKLNGTVYQAIRMSGLLGTYEKIFELFDFTVCMAAFIFKNERFEFHDNFFKHLAQRRIVFNNKTPFPLASLVRTKKYMAKGYTMSNVETVKIALAINKLNLNEYKELRAQLMGIDTSILKPMIDKLGEMSYIDKEEFLEKANDSLNQTGWEQNQD